MTAQLSENERLDIEAPSRMRVVAQWLHTVFIKRRLHVPGDSCRYIWQKTTDIDGRYVIYRAANTFFHSLSLLISFFHISTECPLTEKAAPHWLCIGPIMGVTHSWPFYLTRWGIIINVTQSAIALAIIVKAFTFQRRGLHNPYASLFEHSLRKLTGLVWALHSLALVASVIIDLSYWILVVKIPGPKPTLFNILTEHCFNFILLAVDHAIVAFPVLLMHGVLIAILGVSYVVVSFVYYASGGMDYLLENHHLYEFMNWEHPGDCILMTAMLMCFAFFLLLLLLIIDHFKFKYCRKARKGATTEQSVT